MTSVRDRVIAEFELVFREKPALLTRAPGRVNLIGEHTDYNDGFVLPVAIDRAAWIALRPRRDGGVVVHSLDFREKTSFRIGPELTHGRGWHEYVRGVAWIMHEMGGLPLDGGWEGVVAGDVPLGAGLSSSAALELATARAFAAAASLDWSPAQMARLAQRAENEWVGVNCGIMDQLICAAGEKDHALLIDCRTLETRSVSLPLDVAIVVLDTATRRGLVDSAYNERRAQCEAAATFFGVPALRDVDAGAFYARAHELDEVIRRRARHVITENARTLAAADALERRDLAAVGALMNESHASLRNDFDVSRAELDLMAELAREHEGCYGARMTGAGFGGCAVALVQAIAAPRFARAVSERYRAVTGLSPAVYVCSAMGGASVEAVARR